MSFKQTSYIIGALIFGYIISGCSVSDSEPGDLPVSSFIGNVVYIQSDSRIYIWYPSTRELIPIIDDVESNVHFIASRSGKYVAFARRAGEEFPENVRAILYLYNTETGEEKRIETELLSLGNLQMAWAPDESKLLVTAVRGESPFPGKLLLISASSGDVTQIVTNSYRLTGPAWHPDSHHFTYMEYQSEAAFSSAVGYYGSLTETPVAITEGRSMLSNLQFSPDGKLLAFHELADSTHTLSTLTLPNRNYQKRLKMSPFSLPDTGGMPSIFGPHDASGRNIIWIPESVNRLAFWNYLEGKQRRWYIYSLPSNHRRPLVPQQNIAVTTPPDFSVDGRFAAFYTRHEPNRPASSQTLSVYEVNTGKSFIIDEIPTFTKAWQILPYPPQMQHQ